MTLSLPRRWISSSHILSIPTLLTVIWLCTLWWGERLVFEHRLESCEWDRWEQWPSHAVPHRVILVADPQVVDPHTYPGRPWPLSTLTIWYSDLYLRRSYRLLRQRLDPDTIFFLGDLFDGGREWATPKTKSPDERFKRYGHKYWIKEYGRFARLFLQDWGQGSHHSLREPRGRRLISSLPGNHDLGFGSGIRGAVKDRFDAYFGPLNRIDMVGNHTFVSLDSVSLSAMDQVDLATGSSGLGDGTAPTTNSGIWRPPGDFLDQARDAKARAVQREYRSLSSSSDPLYSQGDLTLFSRNITTLRDSPPILRMSSTIPLSTFPTILLTHVPLYRAGDAACGPLRERGTSIPISAGYQYQNVLTPLISRDIIAKLGAEEVAQIYSGDDHDYCDFDHLEFTGRINEITVKSVSFAMGVRRPGFQAISLHNPVDLTSSSQLAGAQTGIPKDTIQNHLCLLPDQLGIFIRYAQLLGVTLVVLVLRALFLTPQSQSASSKPPETTLLPLSSRASHRESTSSHTSQMSASSNRISTRPSARSSSPSKLGGYGNLPASSRSSSPTKHSTSFSYSSPHFLSGKPTEDWSTRPRGRQSSLADKLVEFNQSILRVAIPVLLVYIWLMLD